MQLTKGPRATGQTMKNIVTAAVAAMAMGAAASAAAVEWGTAGVLSQQGQRLKVAVPYSGPVGEDLSVVQFTVVSSLGPAGSFSPEPANFTISKAPQTNMVILQSAETVNTDSINLVMRVASKPDSAVRYELKIPPRK